MEKLIEKTDTNRKNITFTSGNGGIEECDTLVGKPSL